MFSTYVIIATYSEGRGRNRRRRVIQFDNVKKNDLTKTVAGLYDMYGITCEVDILQYRFNKCVKCYTL